MNLAGETEGRQPLRHRPGIEKGAIDPLRGGAQDAVKSDCSGAHGCPPVRVAEQVLQERCVAAAPWCRPTDRVHPARKNLVGLSGGRGGGTRNSTPMDGSGMGTASAPTGAAGSTRWGTRCPIPSHRWSIAASVATVPRARPVSANELNVMLLRESDLQPRSISWRGACVHVDRADQARARPGIPPEGDALSQHDAGAIKGGRHERDQACKPWVGTLLCDAACERRDAGARAEEIHIKMLDRSGSGPLAFEPGFVKANPGDVLVFEPAQKGGHSTVALLVPPGRRPGPARPTGKPVSPGCRGVHLYACAAHKMMGWLASSKLARP